MQSIRQLRTRVWAWAAALSVPLLLWGATSYAGDNQLVSPSPSRGLFRLEKFQLGVSKFLDNRDPQTPQYPVEAWDKRAAFNFDWNILGVLFMENRVHLETLRTGEVKTAGWYWMSGLSLGHGIDVGYEHHSQHILDESSQVPRTSTNKFPVEDAYTLRITMYEDRNARGGIFK